MEIYKLHIFRKILKLRIFKNILKLQIFKKINNYFFLEKFLLRIGCLTRLPSSSMTSLPGHFRWAYGFLPRVRFGFCTIGSFSPGCLLKGSYYVSLLRHSVIGIELRLTISSVVLGHET